MDEALPSNFSNTQVESFNPILTKPEAFGATSEYRAAFITPSIEAFANTPPAGNSTGAFKLNGASAKKSMTISDFNSIPQLKSRTHVLFDKEPLPIQVKPERSVTEYKKKYKPFTNYVYVAGKGWKKSKYVKEPDSEKVVDWYGEVAERIKKANEFRSRSQFGHPVVSIEHLEEIYRETDPNSYTKDRSIAALALATTQLRIQEAKLARASSKQSTPQRSHSHLSAIISPKKERHISRQTASRSATKSPPEPRKSRSVTPGGARPVSSSSESPAGKIWLKPRKEETKTKEFDSSTRVKEIAPIKPKDDKSRDNNDPMPSNKSSITSSSDENQRSPRPSSLMSNGLNGEVENFRVADIPEGPVKTTEIKSPEEATGVKSPSPEHWKVQVDTGANINWTDNCEKSLDISGDTNNNENLSKDLTSQTKESSLAPGSNQNEDFGPLSI